LAVDLFCGLGGWTEGMLAEGFECIGFDIERHDYGSGGYPAQLVLQDVLTLHGSQFKDAALIVASPPCQEYSYMAMPWKLAKAKAAAIRADTTGESLVALNRLFNACSRIQAEASLAAGRHIPLVIENVRGAQPWVGRARWNFGSFYLFGDVPALMPMVKQREVMKAGVTHRSDGSTNFHGHKNNGGSWFAIAHNTTSGHSQNARDQLIAEGRKHKDQDGYERNHPSKFGWKKPRTSSKSNARKAASAVIAKIPLPLSRYIASVFKPREAA